MPRLNPSTRGEQGSASLEFIAAGMLLLLPLVYLVLAVSAVQAGALAVEGAARQAARVFVQSANQEQAAARAQRAIRFALDDYDLAATQPAVRVVCSPQPEVCLHRLGRVTITVEVAVVLPLVPASLTSALPLAVPIRATASEQVSRFWSGE